MTARAYIRGAGTSSFGRQPAVPLEELVSVAITEALDDAGGSEFDAVFVGTAWGRVGTAQRMLLAAGVAGVPVLRYENACASGATAFHEAVVAVESGRFDTVLVLGFEQMSTVVAAGIPAREDDVEGRLGRTAAALYALSADRYIQHGDLTPADLASVAVKNLRHGAGNRRTLGRTPRTVEEVLASPMVADPLTRLQCGPIADGAGALVVSRNRSAPDDVAVRGTALHGGEAWTDRSPHPWGFDLVAGTAAEAFEQAAVEVEDIDCFEVHDSFTIGEVITCEALGLAPVWSGQSTRDPKHSSLGGLQPVNPSGGLIARGHPLGATGVVQLAEIAWQLRGQAEGHQVEGARLGVAETMGGGASGLDGNACVISVLEAGR